MTPQPTITVSLHSTAHNTYLIAEAKVANRTFTATSLGDWSPQRETSLREQLHNLVGLTHKNQAVATHCP